MKLQAEAITIPACKRVAGWTESYVFMEDPIVVGWAYSVNGRLVDDEEFARILAEHQTAWHVRLIPRYLVGFDQRLHAVYEVDDGDDDG